MSAPDMDPDREEIENLIDGAEADIELNPVEFMEPATVDYMNNLWDGLDERYRS